MANHPPDGEDTMRLLGSGFLIVWVLASAPMAITVADSTPAPAVAPEATQSLPQPAPGVEEDLLNTLD